MDKKPRKLYCRLTLGKYLEDNGIEQTTLAKWMKTPRQYVGELVNGQRMVTLNQLCRIVDILRRAGHQCSPEDLYQYPMMEG